MNKRSSTIVGLVVVSVTVFGVFAMMASKPMPPKKPPQPSTPLVEVMEPEAQTVRFSVESHGVVQPRTETTLVSEVSGVIQEVSERFVAGGYFSKGDILLKIDPTDYQVAYEQAKARLASQQALYTQEKARAEQARKEWDLSGRSRKDAPALALREPFLLEAQANVQSAEADLKKAQQKLNRTVIRAPYDGMVKTKLTDVGQFVATGTQLGVTFAIDYAEIRLPLTEQELAFIHTPTWEINGQAGERPDVELSAHYAGEMVAWTGKLVRMEGVVDQQSRVHYAVVRVTDPYSVLNKVTHRAPLKIGTFVTAKIDGIEMDSLIKLPRDAFRDLNTVLVSDSNKQLYSRNLEVVRAEGDYVYVRQGLQSGDRVVLTSVESPIQGMKIRVEGEPEAEPVSESSEVIAKNGEETKPRQ